MFYDKYVLLCKQKGVSPSRAAEEAGFARSLVTKWRKNKVEVPSADILSKLSTYFMIPVSELLGEETKKEQPTEVDELYIRKQAMIEKVRMASASEMDLLERFLALVEKE